MKRITDIDQSIEIAEELDDMHTRVCLTRDDTGEWWAVVRTDGQGRGYSYQETVWRVDDDDPIVVGLDDILLEVEAIN